MMVTTVMTIMMMVLDGDGNRANECGDVDDDLFPSTSIQEGNETANSQMSKLRILRQHEHALVYPTYYALASLLRSRIFWTTADHFSECLTLKECLEPG